VGRTVCAVAVEARINNITGIIRVFILFPLEALAIIGLPV
jgi:hypothetical protein